MRRTVRRVEVVVVVVREQDEIDLAAASFAVGRLADMQRRGPDELDRRGALAPHRIGQHVRAARAAAASLAWPIHVAVSVPRLRARGARTTASTIGNRGRGSAGGGRRPRRWTDPPQQRPQTALDLPGQGFE